MFEGFDLPYVPAAGLMAKRFDRMRSENVAGWVDYDCGGIHQGLILDLARVVQRNPDSSLEEWLQLLAHERYGSGAEIGRAAWEAFDRGVQVFPTVLDFKSVPEFSGRFGDGAIALTMMHPFIVERARLAKDGLARDSGGTYYWFDPHNFLTSEAIPAIRHCLVKALDLGCQGKAAFDRLTDLGPPAIRANAQFDSLVAELTVLSWQSALNFFQWGAAVQGDKSVDVPAVLRDEIAQTRRYRELWSLPELELGNMTGIPQLEVISSVPGLAPELFDWKIQEITGDLFDLKIKDLSQQLKSWPT
jgi:hypothetical protein